MALESLAVRYTTTMSGARAIARAIHAAQNNPLRVESIQDYYRAAPVKG